MLTHTINIVPTKIETQHMADNPTFAIKQYSYKHISQVQSTVKMRPEIRN